MSKPAHAPRSRNLAWQPAAAFATVSRPTGTGSPPPMNSLHCPRQLCRPRPRPSPPDAAGPRGLGLVWVATLAGCQLWPFRDNERTSIITPAMRAASIREIGARADDATEAEQLAMCEELAQQIRTEPDPIVRRAIQETIAEFETPLASAVLLAGLNDDDRDVRTACCRLLGQRKDPAGRGAAEPTRRHRARRRGADGGDRRSWAVRVERRGGGPRRGDQGSRSRPCSTPASRR